MKPGIYLDLSNEEYHASDGISNSGLSLIDESPASYIWSKSAPVNEDKTKPLDLGTAVHCAVLEPDKFESRFVICPEVNRRTTAGRDEERAFFVDCYETGRTPMTAEEGKQIAFMRDSVMAHPDAKWLLQSDGVSEASIYWNDNETGELCRIRPDRMINDRPIIVDVKTVAGMDRFQRQVFDFGYHRQDAMYCDGYKSHFGEDPIFLFLIVSSTVSCGRYPVRVRPLDADAKELGHQLYRKNLNEYHKAKIENDWHDFKPIEAPYWLTRNL